MPLRTILIAVFVLAVSFVGATLAMQYLQGAALSWASRQQAQRRLRHPEAMLRLRQVPLLGRIIVLLGQAEVDERSVPGVAERHRVGFRALQRDSFARNGTGL